MRQGIDLFHETPVVGWEMIKNQGQAAFAFHKVSEGVTTADAMFAKRQGYAEIQKLPFYAYTMVNPLDDAKLMAEFALSLALKGGPVKYLAADLEDYFLAHAPTQNLWDQVSLDSTGTLVKQFCLEIQAAGVEPVIYTGKAFWEKYFAKFLTDPFFADIKLWICHPSTHPPQVPAPWNRWHFWQHAFNMPFPGVAGNNIDLNFVADDVEL